MASLGFGAGHTKRPVKVGGPGPGTLASLGLFCIFLVVSGCSGFAGICVFLFFDCLDFLDFLDCLDLLEFLCVGPAIFAQGGVKLSTIIELRLEVS